MSLPGLAFGVLWTLALAFTWYAWKGYRGCLWLVATLLFTGLGFVTGHLLARWQGWTWGQVGPWALGPALLGALTALALLHGFFSPSHTTDGG